MFEEVKEMIDSTIYENGRGDVTAKNLNLAFHGIVDATETELGKVNDAVKDVEDKVTALEENGTGGDVAYVYVPFDNQLSDAQIEENKKSYVKILNGADLKFNVMGAIGNAEFYRIESGAIIFGVIVHGTAKGSSGARIYHESLQCILSNDGTVIVDEFNDCNIPAPSGPLRVWINEENTPEQTAENKATYNALVLNGTQSVILTNSSTLDGKESVITYNPIMTKITAADSQIQFTVAVNFGEGLVDFTITLSSDGSIV